MGQEVLQPAGVSVDVGMDRQQVRRAFHPPEGRPRSAGQFRVEGAGRMIGQEDVVPCRDHQHGAAYGAEQLDRVDVVELRVRQPLRQPQRRPLEQVAGKALDPRSDLFSLGVMLYEMVTGRKPFTGDSVITITYNIMNLDPAAPAGVPPAVQGIVRRAMAKDPVQRYPDAGAMMRDLEAVASGRLPAGGPPVVNRPAAPMNPTAAISLPDDLTAPAVIALAHARRLPQQLARLSIGHPLANRSRHL